MMSVASCPKSPCHTAKISQFNLPMLICLCGISPGEVRTPHYTWALPDVVAESVERRPRVREIGSLVPGQVKPMTYQIDTCRFLAWCFALIG